MTAGARKMEVARGKLQEGEREESGQRQRGEPDEIPIPLTKFPLRGSVDNHRTICDLCI